MIISINQPAYLPWLGYFDRILKSDLHIVLDHVQFEKNSFINRNKILLGLSPLWLTIPVSTKGKFGDLAISNLEIDNKLPWKKKHWQSIQHAYAKYDFWKDLSLELEEHYKKDTEKLIDFITPIQQLFLNYLGITSRIESSSKFNFKSTKNDLILEICQFFEAKTYISGPLGRDYLDENQFKKNNIEIIYHDYVHPRYNQKSSEFIPYLSTLDLIMNHGKNSLEVLKNV